MINIYPVGIFMVTFLLSMTNVLAAESQFGYIKNISGSDSVTVSLIRNNEPPITAVPSMTILTGDKLVPEANKGIVIEYCDNGGLCSTTDKEKKFPSSSNGTYVNTKAKDTSWLSPLIWDKTKYYAIQAVSRSKNDSNLEKYPPEVYLADMTEAPQDIFLGKRSLTFRWIHGAAPFTIKIMQHQQLVYKGEAEQRYIQTNKINWKLGEYQISIIDKHKRTESIVFNVIKKPLVLQEIMTFLDGKKDIEMYTRLGVLAMVDGGRYALEAYQQLLPVSTRTPVLMYLLKAIEAGDEFPELKSKDVAQRFVKGLAPN